MKALDPLKLLGTTFSQSLARDGEADSEKARVAVSERHGGACDAEPKGDQGRMNPEAPESNSPQTALLLSWEQEGRWHVWQGLILGETLCVAEPRASHYPETAEWRAVGPSPWAENFGRAL